METAQPNCEVEVASPRNIRPPCLLAFVPEPVARDLKTVALTGRLSLVGSWSEVETSLRANAAFAVAVDPGSGTEECIDRTIAIIRSFPLVPFFACVRQTPESFRAVFRLSQCGLAGAFVHPIEDPRRIQRTLNRHFAATLVNAMLSPLEIGLQRCPHKLAEAVADLFQRPHLYANALDLAVAAQVSGRCLFRKFATANLGNPKKLVIAAKLLRAYAYLQTMDCSVDEASEKVGYRSRRRFSMHASAALGNRPSVLAREPDAEEIIRDLLDWVYKPTVRSLKQLLA